VLVGYLYGIRSETRLCEEVHLNLAYRWFCRLGLDGDVPERSTFSKNRYGRFREGDLFRRLFEEVVRRCVVAGLVGGTGVAVDGSVVEDDASCERRLPGDRLPEEWSNRESQANFIKETAQREALQRKREQEEAATDGRQIVSTSSPTSPSFATLTSRGVRRCWRCRAANF
jgi:hypothetical protein